MPHDPHPLGVAALPPREGAPTGSPRASAVPRPVSPREKVLLAAVEQASNGVIITDARGTIEYVNGAFHAMTGYAQEEAVGLNPRILKSGLQSEALYRHMWSELGAGRAFSTVFQNRRKDGSLYLQQSTITPVRDEDGVLHYLGVTEDVSRARALEDQAQRSQRLEALGQFTSSIAHDFNNILSVVLGNLELLVEDLPASDELQELLQEALQATGRGSELIRQLMAYARDEPFVVRSQRLPPLLEKVSRLIERLLPEDIRLVPHIEVDGIRCRVDASALDQILLNLATNARDAMPRGGTLILNASVMEVPGPHCGLPSPHVHLRVEDDGVGMDADTANKIFDPFFTTKEVGEGTGLGLSMAHSILEKMGGTIDVESYPGIGTTFHICLAIDGSPEEPQEVRTTSDSAGRRAARILLVEDAEPVRRASHRALKSLGHAVVAVSDAEKALIVLEGSGEAFDIVVSDVVLPRMSGPDLHDRLDPDTRPPFLFVSGHVDVDLDRLADKPFVRKPWTLAEMARHLERLLP